MTYQDRINAKHQAWKLSLDRDENVRKAFSLMRKFELIARMNFWCCGTCASYAMGTKVEEALEKGKAPVGVAYFHNQDNNHKKAGHSFHIGYGDSSINDYKGPLTTVEVGELICQIFLSCGVPVKWNQDPAHRIEVL